MPEADISEKTEQPTSKRLREARERGNVAQSKELAGFAGFVAACLCLAVSARPGVEMLKAYILSACVELPGTGTSSPGGMVLAAAAILAKIVVPVAGAAALASFAVNFIQTGGLVTAFPLNPDISRLSPAKGMKEFFSKEKLLGALLAVAKVATLFFGVFLSLKAAMNGMAVREFSAGVTAGLIRICLSRMAVAACIVLAGWAILDFLMKRSRHRKRLMMSRQEVVREMKEDEGDPVHRAERKRLHKEIIQHKAFEGVRNASVVVVNPTHIAVALRYEAGEEEAPVLVAKGYDEVAFSIRRMAEQSGVPVVENIPVARALVVLDVGEMIPEELYEAVAEVLKYVHGLEEKEM